MKLEARSDHRPHKLLGWFDVPGNSPESPPFTTITIPLRTDFRWGGSGGSVTGPVRDRLVLPIARIVVDGRRYYAINVGDKTLGELMQLHGFTPASDALLSAGNDNSMVQ